MTADSQTLLTVPQVARLLHISGDTVRRQIRAGDLEAILIGTTPAGRPRYRVASAVIEQRLARTARPAPPTFERLREAFAPLSDEDREALIERAVQWARAHAPALPSAEPRLPEPSQDDLARQFGGKLHGRKGGA